MKSFGLGSALSGSLAIVLITGCGELQPPVRAPGAPSGVRNIVARSAVSGSQTFNYTGKKQLFVVPAGVTTLAVVARGASGNVLDTHCSKTGRGARVYAVIRVTAGETLHVYVGGVSSRSHGGFNGGGGGGNGYGYAESGGGGGGATDIRRSPGRLVDRIIVAGGGGGAGGHYSFRPQKPYSCGGAGGEVGEPGHRGFDRRNRAGRGGRGGTQTGGGKGGNGGSAFGAHFGSRGYSGTLGTGGDGVGDGDSPSDVGDASGGGGGGYYGGGGGGAGVVGAPAGGGGGGSSFVKQHATDVHFWTGWKNATGNGLVVVSW